MLTAVCWRNPHCIVSNWLLTKKMNNGCDTEPEMAWAWCDTLFLVIKAATAVGFCRLRCSIRDGFNYVEANNNGKCHGIAGKMSLLIDYRRHEHPTENALHLNQSYAVCVHKNLTPLAIRLARLRCKGIVCLRTSSSHGRHAICDRLGPSCGSDADDCFHSGINIVPSHLPSGSFVSEGFFTLITVRCLRKLISLHSLSWRNCMLHRLQRNGRNCWIIPANNKWPIILALAATIFTIRRICLSSRLLAVAGYSIWSGQIVSYHFHFFFFWIFRALYRLASNALGRYFTQLLFGSLSSFSKLKYILFLSANRLCRN